MSWSVTIVGALLSGLVGWSVARRLPGRWKWSCLLLPPALVAGVFLVWWGLAEAVVDESESTSPSFGHGMIEETVWIAFDAACGAFAGSTAGALLGVLVRGKPRDRQSKASSGLRA